MEEEWRDIRGYEGLYQVSSFGKVKSLDRTNFKFNRSVPLKGRILKLNTNIHGYPFATIYKNGVSHSITVHRLVAETFIPNPDNKPQVNHINGCKSDNRVDNLEWVTASENQTHSFRVLGTKNSMKGKYGKQNAKSKVVLQMDMNGRFIAEYESAYEASRHTDGSPQGISRCCRGGRNSHKGFIWKYK